jgi:hypothetical protein
MGSTTIVEKLIAIEDSPWSEWSHGKPLSTAKLALMLKGYGVLPAGCPDRREDPAGLPQSGVSRCLDPLRGSQSATA